MSDKIKKLKRLLHSTQAVSVWGNIGFRLGVRLGLWLGVKLGLELGFVYYLLGTVSNDFISR